MSVKKCVEKHETEYWHVPKFGLLPLFLTFVFGFLSLKNLDLIRELWILLDLQDLTYSVGYQFVDLSIIPLFLVEYLLIGFTWICFVAFLKNGFNNLKSYNKDGLISGLIGGLIFGLIGGLIIGVTGEFE